MKLSFVFTTMTIGGVGKVFCDLANGLVDKGVDIDFVLYKAAGPLLDDLDPRVNVVCLGVLRHPWSLFAFPPLLRYLGRRRPDVVLSAVSGPNVAVLLALALLRARSRAVVTYHASVGSESISGLLRRLQNRLYRRADRVVAVSEGVAHELADATAIPRHHIRVIPNPVDLERIAAAAREPVTENDWFEPGAPPVILGVGRLHPQKDFDKLLDAFALVRRKTRARLLVLGDGPSRQQLEVLAGTLGLSDDVSFPGFARNPYKYMARAAVFVLPSRFEGLPTVLIEALACGCPVVSTDCPHGPREILEDGRWGQLVPVGYVSGLEAAIEQALARPQPADELKARAQHYGQERAVRQYYDLVTGLGNDR